MTLRLPFYSICEPDFVQASTVIRWSKHFFCSQLDFEEYLPDRQEQETPRSGRYFLRYAIEARMLSRHAEYAMSLIRRRATNPRSTCFSECATFKMPD